jgi:hypothetical protein
MFGRARRNENLLAEYKALISDLRDQIRERDEQLRSLTDQLIALSSPAALREVRRPPSTPTPPVQAGGSTHGKRRIHWPGYQPNLRPPSPPSPPAPARSIMTDGEKAAVLSQVDKPDA